MKTILDFFIEYNKTPIVSFCAPGHKGRSIEADQDGYADFYKNLLGEDIAEGSDETILLKMKELIESTKDYYADLYGVKYTELLTGGSGQGIMASILTCVPYGGKLILGRDSAQTAFDTMRIGNIMPVYMRPGFSSQFGMFEAVKPDEVRMACEDHPDAGAVYITSPTAYGMLADVGAISEIVHDFGMKLIVDQTWGAHLKFFDAVNSSRTAAEDLGADLVINGAGKTLLSLAGTAILNVCSDRIDIDRLDDVCKMFNETDISFMALGSLDMNEKIFRRYGGEIVTAWTEDLKFFFKELRSISGVRVAMTVDMDPTKINISLAQLGITGTQLWNELRQNHIYCESAHGDYVLLCTGPGNCRQDYEDVIRVIRSLSENNALNAPLPDRESIKPDFALKYHKLPVTKIAVPLYQADGRVLFNPIITYPPDGAIACPGEVLNMEVISYVARALERGDRVIGVDDEGFVFIG